MTMSTTPPPAGKPLAQSRPDLPARRALQQHAVTIREVTLREMFAGDRINISEHPAALHTALRAPRGARNNVDGENVVPQVHDVVDQMATFADSVRNGQWTGHTGQLINAVVNIGIGGSDLGPRITCQALRTFGDCDVRMEFISNIDGAEFVQATRDLDPARTLFAICSKSWHTSETLTNAATARDWPLKGLDSDTSAIARHFVAVSTFTDLARDTEGRAWVQLIAPDGAGLTLWADAAYPFVEIYTAHTQPEPHWRTGRGVEPRICAPNAFRSGDGLIHLAPGESTSATWGLRASPLGASEQSHSAAAGRRGAPDAPERPRGSSSSKRVAMSLLPAVS